MYDRPVVWDRANRKHIEEDHSKRGITADEVDQAMTDANRDELPDPQREGYRFCARSNGGRSALACRRGRISRWSVSR